MGEPSTLTLLPAPTAGRAARGNPIMKSLTGWLITAVFFLALGAATAWLLLREHEPEEGGPTSASQPAGQEEEPTIALGKDHAGNTVVTLSPEARERLGLRTAAVAAAATRPAVQAFGKLIEDPSAGFALRAPLAGQLVVAEGPWPSVGARVQAGAVLAGLRPTLAATERADLSSRLVNARADVQAAEASVAAQRAAYQSRRAINREEPIVSDITMQEAAAKLAGEEARLNAARETVRILEMWTSTTKPAEEARLQLPLGGLVTEVGAQPGEVVEPGQVILRLTDPTRLLASVSVPLGRGGGSDFESAVVLPAGRSAVTTTGKPVPAGSSDPQTGGTTWLVPLAISDAGARPGTPVTAWLHTAEGSTEGVMVPTAALVRLEGRAWVYCVSDQGFVRLPVNLLLPMGEGWLATGLGPGQEIVVEAAGGLLSAELNTAAGVGEEEE